MAQLHTDDEISYFLFRWGKNIVTVCRMVSRGRDMNSTFMRMCTHRQASIEFPFKLHSQGIGITQGCRRHLPKLPCNKTEPGTM